MKKKKTKAKPDQPPGQNKPDKPGKPDQPPPATTDGTFDFSSPDNSGLLLLLGD